MIEVHFYDEKTGIFSGHAIRVSKGSAKRIVRANTPEGHRPYIGPVDHLSQRVEVETGNLVAYQPPAPDADHEWNGKRWVKRAEVVERERRRAQILARIGELEARQARPMRELMLDPTNEEERRRLAEIRAQITAARAEISETGTTGREAERN